MNWDRIEGNWKQFKGKVHAQWGKLTDDDLEVIDGHREELAGRIQEVYGISKDEAERQIERFESSLSDIRSHGDMSGSKPRDPRDSRMSSGTPRNDTRAPSR